MRPDFSAMLRWPKVPACYGWLSLDQRGRWRMRGEAVSHRGLRDFLNRQYAHDEDGNYFVQNGPQRVFVDLDYTPWVLHLATPDCFATQVGEAVSELRAAAIDEEGNLLLEIPAGIALLCDRDLPTLLPCLHLANGEVADDDALLAAIAQAAGGVNANANGLTLVWHAQHLPVRTLQRSDIPKRYGFIASPQEAPPGVLP